MQTFELCLLNYVLYYQSLFLAEPGVRGMGLTEIFNSILHNARYTVILVDIGSLL